VGARAARWILWGGALALAPVPIAVVGPGWVPAAHLFELGALCLAVALLESARGALPLLTAFLLGQGLFWAALFWPAAGLAVRALARRAPRALGPVALGLVAAGLAVTSAFAVYETPYAAQQPRATVWRVYR
jgi:hypothetical protein